MFWPAGYPAPCCACRMLTHRPKLRRFRAACARVNVRRPRSPVACFVGARGAEVSRPSRGHASNIACACGVGAELCGMSFEVDGCRWSWRGVCCSVWVRLCTMFADESPKPPRILAQSDGVLLRFKGSAVSWWHPDTNAMMLAWRTPPSFQRMLAIDPCFHCAVGVGAVCAPAPLTSHVQRLRPFRPQRCAAIASDWMCLQGRFACRAAPSTHPLRHPAASQPIYADVPLPQQVGYRPPSSGSPDTLGGYHPEAAHFPSSAISLYQPVLRHGMVDIVERSSRSGHGWPLSGPFDCVLSELWVLPCGSCLCPPADTSGIEG